jgi:SapC protein
VIAAALYRQPELLDSQRHKGRRLNELTDWSIAKELHAMYLTATEFTQAALDYPIVFVRTDEKDAKGRTRVSPVVLLGLEPGENLYVEGTKWDARYLPAFVRRYPFFSAAVAGLDRPGVFIDTAWRGFSETEGTPLFEGDGQPTPALKNAIEFLERFQAESERTTMFCERLLDLDILKDMRADVQLLGGGQIRVEGFQAIDEEKLQALKDPLVVELHRKGLLMLMQIHLLSLANLRHLVQRKADRILAADPSQGQPPAPPGANGSSAAKA